MLGLSVTLSFELKCMELFVFLVHMWADSTQNVKVTKPFYLFDFTFFISSILDESVITTSPTHFYSNFRSQELRKMPYSRTCLQILFNLNLTIIASKFEISKQTIAIEVQLCIPTMCSLNWCHFFLFSIFQNTAQEIHTFTYSTKITVTTKILFSY